MVAALPGATEVSAPTFLTSEPDPGPTSSTGMPALPAVPDATGAVGWLVLGVAVARWIGGSPPNALIQYLRPARR